MTRNVDYLWTGAVVLRAVVQIMPRLQSTGHVIALDDDTRVRIAPVVPEDTWYVLDSNWRDVAAVLDAEELTWGPIHTPALSWTVH